jgi:hypothetical protein
VIVRRGASTGDDETEVAPAQADVDRAGRQLAGDLLGGAGESAEQRETHRCLQRGGEPLREGAGLVTTDVRGGHELPPQLVDIGREIHDVRMTSNYRQRKGYDGTLTSHVAAPHLCP